MADDDSTTSIDTTATTTDEQGEPAGGQQRNGEQKNDVPPEVRRALTKANKEAETLRLKLKEYEDRDKTEAEKSSERLTAAEERAARAELNVLRMEVAAEKGLTPAQAKRLVGATREELEADAEELKATFTPAAPANERTDTRQIRPTPNLRRQVPVSDGGERQNTNAQMNDWLRQSARK